LRGVIRNSNTFGWLGHCTNGESKTIGMTLAIIPNFVRQGLNFAIISKVAAGCAGCLQNTTKGKCK
ncbi:MAG: hypothetical protein IIT61_06155, partial [Bacteroidales bacterium]|nr:hypothetical protein [Bacteroidales bacterium]